MSVSIKNTLQEYYMARQESLPKYTTTRIGGTDSRPIFRSEVELPDGTTLLGNPSTTKRDAEKNAAEAGWAMVQAMQTIARDERIVPDPSRRITIWIDSENFPKAMEQLDKQVDLSEQDVKKVASVKHPNLDDHIVVNVTRSDGADLAIVMLVTEAIIMANLSAVRSEEPEEHIILTKDHFGATLVDLINSGLLTGGAGVRAKHCCRIEDLVNDLTPFRSAE